MTTPDPNADADEARDLRGGVFTTAGLLTLAAYLLIWWCLR